MKISTKVYLALIFALAIGAPVPSMGAESVSWEKVLEAGKKEGVVNAASSSLSGKAAVAVAKVFKEKYGISLEVIPGRIVTITEKIMVEQKSKSYVTDFLDTHGTSTVLLKNAGYLESVVGNLPVLKEKDKFAGTLTEDPEKELLNILYIHTDIWINTNLVKPGEEPKSYYDLLDPKWKGKITLYNPIYNSAPDQFMVAFSRAGLKEDYFIKLYKNANVGGPGGAGEIMNKLVRGEIAIFGWGEGTSPLKPFLEGAPIKPLALKEGQLIKPMKAVAIKNAPHPNATKVFINWLLSKEGQAVVSKETQLEPVRNDVPSPLPFSFDTPKVILTYKDLVLAEDRRSNNYMANLLGLQR
jgi:ABC-type Fe3+ transport system substrate-binding protein